MTSQGRLIGPGGGVALLVGLAGLFGSTAHAAGGVHVALGDGNDAAYLRLLLLFASVSLAPAVLAVLTSFARIAVVLYFLRAGLGSTEVIPNPVLIGFALLLTACTMTPTLTAIGRQAAGPFFAGRISLAQAALRAEEPLRDHLQRRARPEDLRLLGQLGAAPARGSRPSLASLAASYALAELRIGFVVGFVIYLPFLVIDLVVAGTLGSLGLVSMPHAAVALPFKVLLFVMVDGWRLLTEALLTSLR